MGRSGRNGTGVPEVVLTPEEAVATVVGVSTVLSTDYETGELFCERIVKSGPSLTYATV